MTPQNTKVGCALQTCLALALWRAMATAAAGDLSFGDPANTPRPPSWAVGFPSRSPNLDVLPGFQKPPQGYGIVPFYWWLGDPLTKERLAWQLEQMAGMGVAGYQINYAHSDKGGRSYGLTLPSEPPLFSNDWWELTGWFMQKAKVQGASISLSDYTLGFGQGWCVDEILREHPEVMGQRLRMDNAGKVMPETVPWSLNPMHPMSGKWYAEKFFGQFEQRFRGDCARRLVKERRSAELLRWRVVSENGGNPHCQGSDAQSWRGGRVRRGARQRPACGSQGRAALDVGHHAAGQARHEPH